jgi:hypothetical protein
LKQRVADAVKHGGQHAGLAGRFAAARAGQALAGCDGLARGGQGFVVGLAGGIDRESGRWYAEFLHAITTAMPQVHDHGRCLVRGEHPERG